MQRSIQRRRQQRRSFDLFLVNHDEDGDEDDDDDDEKSAFCDKPLNSIDICYRSIDDHSPVHQKELHRHQILVLTCENALSYRHRLAQASTWLCTTYTEVGNATAMHRSISARR